MKLLNILLMCSCLVVAAVAAAENALEGRAPLTEEGSVVGAATQAEQYEPGVEADDAEVWYDATTDTSSDFDVSDTNDDSEAVTDTSTSDYDCVYSDDMFDDARDPNATEDVLEAGDGQQREVGTAIGAATKAEAEVEAETESTTDDADVWYGATTDTSSDYGGSDYTYGDDLYDGDFYDSGMYDDYKFDNYMYDAPTSDSSDADHKGWRTPPSQE